MYDFDFTGILKREAAKAEKVDGDHDEVARLRSDLAAAREELERVRRAVKSHTDRLAFQSETTKAIALERNIFRKRARSAEAALAEMREAATVGNAAFERAYGKLICGGPVGGGDGNTYVSRVPSKDDFRDALRALIEPAGGAHDGDER